MASEPLKFSEALELIELRKNRCPACSAQMTVRSGIICCINEACRWIDDIAALRARAEKAEQERDEQSDMRQAMDEALTAACERGKKAEARAERYRQALEQARVELHAATMPGMTDSAYLNASAGACMVIDAALAPQPEPAQPDPIAALRQIESICMESGDLWQRIKRCHEVSTGALAGRAARPDPLLVEALRALADLTEWGKKIAWGRLDWSSEDIAINFADEDALLSRPDVQALLAQERKPMWGAADKLKP